MRHFADQHQFLLRLMELRSARQADTEGPRGNEFNCKWQRGIGCVLVGGKFVGLDRFDCGHHVVERHRGGVLGALVIYFARTGDRIKIRQRVRKIINVRKIPEIAA